MIYMMQLSIKIKVPKSQKKHLKSLKIEKEIKNYLFKPIDIFQIIMMQK